MTLYYIDQGSGLWNDPDNWFQNEAGTIPNGQVPSPLDDCVINAGNTADELIGTHSSVVNNGTIIQNFDAITINNGTVNYNGSTVEANNGTVDANDGIVDTNNGTVDANDGIVDTNDGTVTVNNNSGTVTFNNNTVVNNNGTVTSNYYNSILTVNNNSITYNYGTVTTNNGTIDTNSGTVNTNNNGGIVETNDGGTIDNNNGTVNYNSSEGTVTNNCGTIISNDGFAGPCPTSSYTNPNILKADLHASYETGLGTWQNYRANVTGLFAANSGTNRSDYRDHLIREFNRKISVLNQPTGLFIRPFDNGFRFTGVSIQ